MKTEHLLLLAIMMLYLSFTLPGLTRPPTLDEASFMEAAISLKNTGTPTISKLITPEAKEITSADELHQYHPTLYISLLALSMIIFGENVVTLRLVGMFFMLISAVLVYLITLAIHKKYPKKCAKEK